MYSRWPSMARRMPGAYRSSFVARARSPRRGARGAAPPGCVAADELGRRAEAEERDGVLADEGPRVARLRELREEHARRALLARQKLLGRARRLAHPALAALKPEVALLRLQQDDPRLGDAGLAAQLGDPRAARLRLHLGERRVQGLQRLNLARRAVDRRARLRDAPAQRARRFSEKVPARSTRSVPLSIGKSRPITPARARRRLPARRHANFPARGRYQHDFRARASVELLLLAGPARRSARRRRRRRLRPPRWRASSAITRHRRRRRRRR